MTSSVLLVIITIDKIIIYCMIIIFTQIQNLQRYGILHYFFFLQQKKIKLKI